MQSRKSFLKSIGLASLAAASNFNIKNDNDDCFSIIHLTDQHVTSRRKGNEGYKKCIEAINKLNPNPDFVLMGGDMVFDGLYTELSMYEESIKLYKSISQNLNIPYYHCIGNHDVLGLSSRRKVPKNHPKIGRKMIMEELGMENDYYSFNHKGWHFVVLNSIFEITTDEGPTYEARIGDEQLNWLRFDLGENKDMPTIIVSHFGVFNHKGQINNDFEMKAMSPIVLQDNIALRHIMERHNVKAVLQGHIHLKEDYQFNNIWYLTSQSASAAWWGGNWLGFNPAFTVLELGKEDILNWYPVEFDWEHQLEENDVIEKQRIKERQEFEKAQRELYEAETKI